ncbi:MAG: hypothetical protein Q8M92_05050, partial [Candidatus Subteraquimicrobiales bacterium]|nr:hypothetical protein [Candidatus Subteraquimicrobiales bacterium]
KYAPEYISMELLDPLYSIRVYLNMDDLPPACLPTYKLHPGQTMYVTGTPPAYVDGALFDPDNEETYQIPQLARMFVLRCVVKLGFPLLTYDINIKSVSYDFGDSGYDELFAAYALSHYSVTINDRQYSETGDADYDSIAGMRYIGHYGRNPIHNWVVSAGISTDCDVYALQRKDRELIATVGAIRTTGNNIEIDVESLIAPTSTVTDRKEGFYYIYGNMVPRQAVSHIMLRKIFITPNHLHEGELAGDIKAYMDDTGYKLAMYDGTAELVSAIAGDDNTMETDVELGDGIRLLDIDGEVVVGEVSGVGITGLERGLYGTTPAYHDAAATVTAYAKDFRNCLLGNISETTGHVIKLDDDDYSIPDTGYILVGNEIIEYSGGDGKPELVIETRSAFGSIPTVLSPGMPVYYISYFTIEDIRPYLARKCEFEGAYTPRITVPATYDDDPVRYGAIACYIFEVRYETGTKNKVR